MDNKQRPKRSLKEPFMISLSLYIEILAKVFAVPFILGLIISLYPHLFPFLGGWKPVLTPPPLPSDFTPLGFGFVSRDLLLLLFFQVLLSLVLSLSFRFLLADKVKDWGVWLSGLPSRILIFLLSRLKEVLNKQLRPFVPFVSLLSEARKERLLLRIESIKRKVSEYSPVWQRFNLARLQMACYLLFFGCLSAFILFLFIEWTEIWCLLSDPFNWMTDLQKYPLLYVVLKGLRSVFGGKVYLSLLLFLLNIPFVERWFKSLQEDSQTLYQPTSSDLQSRYLIYKVSRFLLLVPPSGSFTNKRVDLFKVYILLCLLELLLLPFVSHLLYV